MSQKGRAVVTGASAGIGKIYADRLAQQGYDIVLIARRADRLNAIAEELSQKYGVETEVVAADLGSIRELDGVAAKLGGDTAISVLVNNAGTSTLGSIVDSKPDDQDSMIAVNVTALVRLTAAVVSGFKERNRGTIINIGSVLGFSSLPISAIYSGTKAFVLNFTRALQDELAATQVKVQLVAPAATATDLWEISGVPLSNLDPAWIMSAEDCVDASLKGLDLGELVTMPSVEDVTTFALYDEIRTKLLVSSQTGKVATRYQREE